MKTICLICKAVNPAQSHRCHNCGTVNGSGASPCSRIADPEGKHLEICRIQLARTVKQRDELAAMIERFTEDVDGQGDEIWAKQLRLHVREIYSENAIAMASADTQTPTTPENDH